MIRHIVFFSAKDKNKIDEVYNGLKVLETIPGDWTLSITKNQKVDLYANDVDVVVYGEFPSDEALERYKHHPIYQECTKTVRPLRDLRYAVDIKAL